MPTKDEIARLSKKLSSLNKGKGGSPLQEPSHVFGYPVQSAEKLGLSEYFKKSPQVAGMAWGGGENNSSPNEPRIVVSNPYNPTQNSPLARAGLYMIEAARHRMSESGYNPSFPLSPEQKTWQKSFGSMPYATDDAALKKSILSRIVTGDVVPGITQTQQVEADSLSSDLWQRDKKAGSPFATYLKNAQKAR
jgi:hypothetical protein